jgi:hypothetical protein
MAQGTASFQVGVPAFHVAVPLLQPLLQHDAQYVKCEPQASLIGGAHLQHAGSRRAHSSRGLCLGAMYWQSGGGDA